MSTQSNINIGQALDARQKKIVCISALTAIGDVERLKAQLGTGLDAGLTINEIKEILIQLYAYCGFPRSLNGISAFMAVLEERKAKGIADPQGKEATILTGISDKYEQGRKVLEKLTKLPQVKPAPGFGVFAPRIDTFLKEHLFGAIFECDVLTYQQRELITISALASMPGVESQLQAHLRMGMNTGINETQLMETFSLIKLYVGEQQAEVAKTLLMKVAKGNQTE